MLGETNALLKRPIGTLKLWEHQCDSVRHLVSESTRGVLRYGVVGMPTGAGKTAVAAATAKHALEDGFCAHVLVVTPFTHAMDSFRSASTYDCGGRLLEVDSDFWLELSPEEGRDQQFVDWLSRCDGRALVTTHSKVVHGEGWVSLLPESCDRLLVICDELHHGGEGATQIRSFLDAVHARGGMVAGLSATLFRTDGRPLFPAAVRPLVFSYTQLAARGLFPEKIKLRMIPLGEASGELTEEHLDQACRYVANEGRVTVMNIQPGASERTASRVVQSLVQAGYDEDRILNAVGASSDVAGRVRSALASERSLLKGEDGSYLHRKIDVAVACHRFRESADLPTCSHVASFGVTTSLQMAVQNIGRALRNKRCIKDYPEDWLNESVYTLFVPVFDEADPGRQRMSQMLLQLSCLLEGSDAVLHFHRMWPSLVKGLRLPPVFRPSFERLAVSCLLGESPEQEANARALVAVETQRLRGVLSRTPSVSEVVSAICEAPVEEEDQVRASLQALLLAADEDPRLLERVQSVICEVAATYWTSRDRFGDEMRRSFEKISGDYAELVVDYDGRLLEGLQAVLSVDRIRSMCERMVLARNAQLSPDEWTDHRIIRRILRPYRSQWGHGARVHHGEQDISAFVGFQCSLADVDVMLRESGFSLELLSIMESYVMDPQALRSQIDKLGAVVERRAATLDERHWRDGPTLRKAVTSPSWTFHGHNLIALELAARRGWRGFAGGQTLVSVLTTQGSPS